MASRADGYGTVSGHFDVLYELSWCIKTVDFHLFCGIFKIVDEHNRSILHRGRLLQHILWVLRDNINPIFEIRLFNIEFNNFLQRSIVIGLEEEGASNIVDVVIGGDPFRYDWLDCKPLV